MPYPIRTLLTAWLLGLLFSANVMAKTGIIEVYSDPPAANVYLDGIYVGKTPYTNPEISIGSHQVNVSQEDSEVNQNWQLNVDELTPKIRWFYFESTKSPAFSGIEEQPQIERDHGNVQFASIPTGALVSINGKPMKPTPVSYRNVDVGQYQVSFQLDDRTLSGSFRIETNETSKLIADFRQRTIIDKWHGEKSKRERQRKAEQKKLIEEREKEREERNLKRLSEKKELERQQILKARDQVHQIKSIAHMYSTNRTYYYSSMKLDPGVVDYYKLPYGKITLEIKNLKNKKSSLQGEYYEGDYVFRYGKHIRRGKLNSGDLASCRFTLYNDNVIQLRYDPDSYGFGKGKGKVFVSIR